MTRETRRKLAGAVLVLAVVAVIALLVQKVFIREPSLEKVMKDAATELNKTCPVMVDAETRLDNAVALPGNIFRYNYTLVNALKEQVQIDTVRKYVEPAIIRNVKTNPQLKFYRVNKTTLEYIYKDRNGAFVHKVTVSPDMY